LKLAVKFPVIMSPGPAFPVIVDEDDNEESPGGLGSMEYSAGPSARSCANAGIADGIAIHETRRNTDARRAFAIECFALNIVISLGSHGVKKDSQISRQAPTDAEHPESTTSRRTDPAENGAQCEPP
jgi:hypothetical protein